MRKLTAIEKYSTSFIALTLVASWLVFWVPIWRSYKGSIKFTYDSAEGAQSAVKNIKVTSLLMRYKGIIPTSQIYGDFWVGKPTGIYLVRINFINGEGRELRIEDLRHESSFKIQQSRLGDENIFTLMQGADVILEVSSEADTPSKWRLNVK